MHPDKISILCTKPLSPALLRIAEQNGFQLDIVPFIKTEPIVSEDLKNRVHYFSSQAIVTAFTSTNAAEVVIKELNGLRPPWKIFCIGNTTRSTLTQYFGEEAIIGFASNARALANVIIRDGNTRQIIFFCGDQRRADLPHTLSSNQINV
jgi:uroporphyrinogen-III synthase